MVGSFRDWVRDFQLYSFFSQVSTNWFRGDPCYYILGHRALSLLQAWKFICIYTSIPRASRSRWCICPSVTIHSRDYYLQTACTFIFVIVCTFHSYLCQGCVEWEWNDLEQSRITLEWKGVDNKSRGTTLASAHVLCLDLLLHVWLRISGGWNCCQEQRREVVYRLIGVDIKDINDFNL